MYHSLHIVICVVIGMAVVDNGNTATTPVIKDDFLSIFGSNAASALIPNLAEEIERRITSRTTTTTTGSPTTPKATAKSQTTKLTRTSVASSTTKKSRTTAGSTTARPLADKLKSVIKLPEIVQDSARAPQTQLENQFPFNFRNNFQNYPGAGPFQGAGRQFNDDSFGGRGFNNPELYRPFNSPLDGNRAGENGAQGIDPRFPGRDSLFNGGNRQFNSPDSSLEFDRYQQNFGRPGFNGRFSDSNRFFDQGFRSDGADRFSNFPGPLNDDRNNLPPNNYRQDLRANYQNSIANDQGRDYPSYSGSPSYPQQPYPQNSFDFLPSQRFQNEFANGFERNQQQRGPIFPPFIPTRSNNGGASVAASGSSLADSNREKDNDIKPGSVSSATRRYEDAEKLLKIDANKPVNDGTDSRIFQARDELENLFFSPLDDYSDVRTRPDAFKQPLINSNVVGQRPENNIS